MLAAARYGLLDGVYLALFVAAVQTLLTSLWLLQERRTQNRRRKVRLGLSRALLFHGLLVVALVSCYRVGAFTAASVGISTRVSAPIAFLTGVGEYFLFAYILSALTAALGLTGRLWAAALRANSLFMPRNRLERIALNAVVVGLNPVTEELMTRGLLVHQLAHVGAPTWVAVALGACVNVITHAYQGWKLIPWHLTFYVATIAILFSPLGLIGAIGFHFTADLMPLVNHRRNLRSYRDFRRAERKAKARQKRTIAL